MYCLLLITEVADSISGIRRNRTYVNKPARKLLLWSDLIKKIRKFLSHYAIYYYHYLIIKQQKFPTFLGRVGNFGPNYLSF